ncbi:MAG: IS1634 family transposase [Acidobacteriota bacterium]
MASLQKVRVQGHTYWRIVESRRINGKPHAIPLLHLGSADALLDRLLQAPEGHLRLRSFRHGDVAALKAVADRLGIVKIIDRHVRRHARQQSVGVTLLLAALNRAARPRSKRGWADWARGTSLERLFPGLNIDAMTSQFFWEQMHRVPQKALRAIEDDLTRRVVADLGLKLDTLFYDTTNFFTFIDSTNDRCTVAKRGHSKQKRFDLRIFGLALLVSRDGQIPLLSHVYEGNTVDAKIFPSSLTRIRERLEGLAVDLDDVTLVYDKGNHSRSNQAQVDAAPFGYVASLTPVHHKELLAIPLDRYRPIGAGTLAKVPVLRRREEIWGRERTVLLFWSAQLHAGQVRGLHQHLDKRLAELSAWQQRLAKPRSGPRSLEAVRRRLDKLLSGQHLKKVLHIDYDGRRKGSNRLRFEVDVAALDHLEREVFGKRLLITDRHDWSDTEILQAYRGQSRVEDGFRQLKDDEHCAVRPQYHWTDQKIHVHTFICLLAFLLGRVVEREARSLGYTMGLSGLIDLLGTVRLAMLLSPSGKRGGRPRCTWQLEQGHPEARRLLRHLVPNKAPFVDTDGTS